MHIDGLPENASVIASPEVWMEGDALVQLARVAAHEHCVCAVGMPDLHPGPGLPIGAAMAFERRVVPTLVGGDAGCGALLLGLSRVKLSPSALERRLRAAFAERGGPPELAEVTGLAQAVWQRGPGALAELTAVADVAPLLAHLATLVADDHGPRSGELPAGFAAALGTIGGGNHFLELGRVATVHDPAATRLGLRRGELVVLAHSGSRGLGRQLAEKWAGRELTTSEAEPYLADLAGAVRFARANRLILAWRMLRALGVSRPAKVSGMLDVVHNTVTLEEVADRSLWVHRKGCAPAHADRLAVVLGSRGTPSYVVLGTGRSEALSSVAHGAGRKMKRSEARAKMKARYRRAQLGTARSGARVICDDPRLLREEHPDAYKDIEPVIASLEAADAARRVAAIQPILTVKK